MLFSLPFVYNIRALYSYSQTSYGEAVNSKNLYFFFNVYLKKIKIT